MLVLYILLMMKKMLLTLSVLILNFLVYAQTQLTEAVDITIKDIYGQVHILSQYLGSGKHVVIDFYSTSCGYCQIYAPAIQAAYVHFGENNYDVIFLTIDVGHTNADVAAFDQTYGVTIPSASGMEGGGNLAHQLFQIQATPSVVLIAPDSAILNPMIWPPTTQNIDAALALAGLFPIGLPDNASEPFLNLYPNPVTDYLMVNYETYSGTTTLSVYDLTGRPVITTLFNEEIALDLNNFAPGIYFLVLVEPSGKNVTRRFMVSE